MEIVGVVIVGILLGVGAAYLEDNKGVFWLTFMGVVLVLSVFCTAYLQPYKLYKTKTFLSDRYSFTNTKVIKFNKPVKITVNYYKKFRGSLYKKIEVLIDTSK